jgi:hypothetical protein
MDPDATNSDLAREVAKTANKKESTFVLELPGGFELRGQEYVNLFSNIHSFFPPDIRSV